MNYWDVLGIEFTVDTAVIKKAYAKQIKIYHPEDNPEGFQMLRQAYETALMHAEYFKKVKGPVEATSSVEHNNKEMLSLSLKPLTKEEAPTIQDKTMEQFMNRVEDIYFNVIWRNDIEYWRKLLEDEAYWNIELKQRLSYRLLKFLGEQYELADFGLAPSVWKLLNQHFFWEEQEKYLTHHFPEKFITLVMDSVRYQATKQPRVTRIRRISYIIYIVFLVSIAVLAVISTLSVQCGIIGIVIAARIFLYLPEFYKRKFANT